MREMYFKKRGFSLLELLISISLIGVLTGIIYTSVLFVTRHNRIDMKRANAYMQIEYALENIRMRTVSAIWVDPTTSFFSSGGDRKDFRLRGENDMYNITPDDTLTKSFYRYFTNTTGAFLLEKEGTPSQFEVLIEQEFHPDVTFTYIHDTEPNYLLVTVNASIRVMNDQVNVTKSQGIVLWFSDILR